jgi:hypothetical protein
MLPVEVHVSEGAPRPSLPCKGPGKLLASPVAALVFNDPDMLGSPGRYVPDGNPTGGRAHSAPLPGRVPGTAGSGAAGSGVEIVGYPIGGM